LFLYAGLAGLLLTFVICVVRVFIRHYYLCNFKLYNNGADSSIEIIREADIVICQSEVHVATVLSLDRYCSTDDHTVLNMKTLSDDTDITETNLNRNREPTFAEGNKSTSTMAVLMNNLSPRSLLNIGCTTSNSVDINSDGTNTSTDNSSINVSRTSVAENEVTATPVVDSVACAMNVMESVPEHGKK
jgi:hypothetical protein